jgi:hypothetical protein
MIVLCCAALRLIRIDFISASGVFYTGPENRGPLPGGRVLSKKERKAR